MSDCQNCKELQELVNDTRTVSNLRQKNIEELTTKVEQLEDNLECQVQQFEILRDEARSQRDKFNKEKNKYEETITNLKTETDTLSFQLVDIKGRENLLLQEKKVLDDKVTLITTQRDGYQTQVRQLTTQVRSLEEGQELKKKEQEQKRLEDEIKDCQQKISFEQRRNQGLQDELGEYQKILVDYLEIPGKTLKEYISMIIKKYEDLKVEKEGQIAKTEGLESQIDELKAQTQAINIEKEEMKQNLGVLKDKYGSVDQNKVLYQYKEVKTDQVNTPYDCRILSESFFPLLQNQTWKIEFQDWEEYKKRRNEMSVRVSVLGYENTGKSYMISKLMNNEIPQGKQTKTQGICILYPKDNSTIPWTALDTPGTNISIRTEHMKNSLEKYFNDKEALTGKELSNEQKLKRLYGDNILIESLLQEFVVHYTQVLLIVVGKMRRDDQRFINRLKNQKEFANKRFIIVHNLMDCTTQEDVEKVIEDDIIETFGAQQRAINVNGNFNKFVYLEKDKRKTEHIVLAHEFSPAGKYYNESAIEYIKNVIATNPYSEKFDLIEAFKNHLNLTISNYLSTTISPIPKQPFALDYGETAKDEVPLGFKLDKNEAYDLKLNFTDEFGKIQTYAEDSLETVPFVVKIATIPTSQGDQRFLQVEFEVSGTCKNDDILTKAQINGNLVVIIIKGKSEDNNKRENGESVKQSTRRFGEFRITTNPIDLEGYSIFKGEKHRVSSDVPGLKTISYRLYEDKADDDF